MLTVTAPAKVNLHLEVLGLRSDGFHELAMVMQSIDLADSLQFTNTADAQITLRCDDSSLSTGADNLVLKAAELLRARSGFNELGVSMYLEKRIPIGAGLAGGSSDGAAALVGLNALWGLGYTAEALESMAAELGSDMPFCVAGGTQLCFGRGELLEPVPPTAEGLAVLLVKDPLVSVSTPWAYQRCKERRGTGLPAGGDGV
jgi:4-diphosphocytidyl-2-C-methyl-D-erythritol kinase